MCFCATASFAAAGLLASVGIATQLRVSSNRERLWAAVPFFFAVQQAAEGILWLSLNGTLGSLAGWIGTYVFLFFATCFWPIICGLAPTLIEQNPRKRRWMMGMTAAGVALGCYLYGMALVFGGMATVFPSKFSGNIFFDLSYLPNETLIRLVYLVVCAIPLLLSSRPRIRYVAIMSSTAFVISFIVYRTTFTSVWCFFAALESAYIYLSVGPGADKRSLF